MNAIWAYVTQAINMLAKDAKTKHSVCALYALMSRQYLEMIMDLKFQLVNGESYPQENSEFIEKPYCTTEYMFGIQNTICYCNDVDFCNRSQKIEARPHIYLYHHLKDITI
ncbi:unnamed protein product [Wuchereria bancrofti]|uniref:Uncharacterized protein n=1 Tax=Wuchereria bancrofti TaxID=6293 RepID=A0A3P7F7I4_WUCBA|nr:unnamed protein product [Wuchereria bancrofti]